MAGRDYTEHYLPERGLDGLGWRRLQDERVTSYFETIPAATI
jgi:hypothetical protein